MSVPIQVFICYKKLLAGNRENDKGGILHLALSEDNGRFSPWMDDAELSAGVAWETEIYRRLLVSDVLVVLIGPGTSESQWVRREIALATALGIAIVPLGFELSRPELDDELKALDINHLQAKISQNIRLPTREALRTELRADLQNASLRTRDKQKDMLGELLSRRNPPVQIAPDNQKAATFAIKTGGRSIPLHIASGDMSKVRGIDVLVNSENDYMQMARFFESRTVSSMLRRRGARQRAGRYEDTIQQELDWQLKDEGRPVSVAEVFATSAGGPDCDLVKINRARYIFHVAAVQAVPAAGTVMPFKQPDQVEACVRSVLSKLAEVNQAKGVISPPETKQRAAQEARAEKGDGIARSIIFPLFGTGQAGSSVPEIIGPMMAGLRGYLDEEDNGELAPILSDIYLSAFKQQDFDDAVQFLRAMLN